MREKLGSWFKSFIFRNNKTISPVLEDETEKRYQRNKKFFYRNESAFGSYSIIKRLEIELASVRQERSGAAKKRMNFELQATKVREIYNIGKEYLPMSEPFWINILGMLLSEMERFDFGSQPSVNINDTDDMLYRRSGWSRSVKEVEVNNILSQVNLLDHTYHVIVAFDEYCNYGEGIAIGKEERIELLFACLLHDYGKSLKMSRHYGFVSSMKDILIYKHQAVSKRLFNKVLEIHFNDDKERFFKSAMIESINEAVEQHHESNPSNVTAIHLKACDQQARKFEMSIHERNKDEKYTTS